MNTDQMTARQGDLFWRIDLSRCGLPGGQTEVYPAKRLAESEGVGSRAGCKEFDAEGAVANGALLAN